MMMQRLLRVIVLTTVALMPATAFAQASIVGTARDASGAVLPGVTVEASSPELIEKVRTVVTNGVGQYSIQDLRPGTYTVTFTLQGFTPVKRDGIELTGSFIATVNADLRVGGVAETITVSGEAPVVDVTSARTQQTIDGKTVAEIPTSRPTRHSRSSCPRSTCRATTSAARRATSSACSRFTADVATKGRSSLTA
jgi:hypothetical protein